MEIQDCMKVPLQDLIAGKIVLPGDPGYDEDRKDFDDLYPAYPQIIVYAASTSDIWWAIRYAQANNLHVAIRSGGHSTAGFSVSNGMILDLSMMNKVTVNAVDQIATVEVGCTFMSLNAELEKHGFHLPGGGCPTVAVAGYMMGGGYGFTSRTFGMNCDNVVQILMMKADGTFVIANENENADLFWAIRGGRGGNFGVLISITYKIHPLDTIYGIQIQWSLQDHMAEAAQALYVIQEKYLCNHQLPEMGIELAVITDNTDKIKKLTFCATWVGDQTELDQAMQPLLGISGAVVTMRLHDRYSKVNEALLSNVEGGLPRDIKAYSRCAYFARPLQASDYQDILQYYYDTAPNQYTIMAMECYGGKINQVAPSAMAFMHRNVLFDLFADGFFNEETNDQEENKIWIEDLFTFLSQYTNGHSYQNYPNRLQLDWKWAYYGNQYSRLVEIKQKYDPENFFRYLQSIGNPTPEQTKSERKDADLQV